MTEEEINIDEPSVDPIEELRKLVSEQRDVILKQNETIKKLETRMNDFDRKSTASVAVKAEEKPEVKAPEPDPQEVAYRAMLREMGIEDNKEPE